LSTAEALTLNDYDLKKCVQTDIDYYKYFNEIGSIIPPPLDYYYVYSELDGIGNEWVSTK